MFFDERFPYNTVGAPIKIGEVDSVVFPVSQLIPNLEKRLFVKGLAIDDYPVHVKDDGFELSGLHKYEL